MGKCLFFYAAQALSKAGDLDGPIKNKAKSSKRSKFAKQIFGM